MWLVLARWQDNDQNTYQILCSAGRRKLSSVGDLCKIYIVENRFCRWSLLENIGLLMIIDITAFY